MFQQAIIYYPNDEKVLAQIEKELAAFRCTASIRYIESLHMNDQQIETLYAALEEEIEIRHENMFQRA